MANMDTKLEGCGTVGFLNYATFSSKKGAIRLMRSNSFDSWRFFMLLNGIERSRHGFATTFHRM
jgi:hypothetical protein